MGHVCVPSVTRYAVLCSVMPSIRIEACTGPAPRQTPESLALTCPNDAVIASDGLDISTHFNRARLGCKRLIDIDQSKTDSSGSSYVYKYFRNFNWNAITLWTHMLASIDQSHNTESVDLPHGHCNNQPPPLSYCPSETCPRQVDKKLHRSTARPISTDELDAQSSLRTTRAVWSAIQSPESIDNVFDEICHRTLTGQLRTLCKV